MEIDHIGYAVKDIPKARVGFEQLGFRFEKTVEDADRNVFVSFGDNGNWRIELVAPLDKSIGSPVNTILKKVGPTPYHICYKVDDLEQAVDELEMCGFHLTLPPQEAVAFGGRKVVFMFSRSAGMIELVEK